MATHIGMYGVNLKRAEEVFGDMVKVTFGDDNHATVSLIGGDLQLREALGAALDQLNHISRERSKRNHPSMFQVDPCDGGSQPVEGGLIPPGARWLSPAMAEAVDELNISAAMDDLARFDNAFEPGFRHREEQDRILDAMDAEYPEDAA